MKQLMTLIVSALTCVLASAAFASSKLYMVIDLSAGANASTYPVSYLEEVPSGGWSDEYKTTKLVMRRIESGTCVVTVSKPYYIGVFEVTQEQYALITGETPSHFEGTCLPVESVSYNKIRGSNRGAQYPSSTDVDTDSFLGKLRERTGLDIDLPTEIQWEYACRANTTTTYSYGDNANGNYMWYLGCSGSKNTRSVGLWGKNNAWGLYDMHGNVWEWCQDWIDDYPSGRVTDPTGPESGSRRVIRGGSWDDSPGGCRCAYRYCVSPGYRRVDVGFRLLLSSQR